MPTTTTKKKASKTTTQPKESTPAPANFLEALQARGVKLNTKGTYDFSAIRGKNCYGNLLDDINFHDADSFEKVAKKAPKAKLVDAPESDNLDFGDRKLMTVGKRVLALVGKNYEVHQHSEILQNVRDAIQRIGIEPVGNIRFDERDRMVGNVWFPGVSEINVLEDKGHNIMVGARFANSYDGTMGVIVEAAGIRTICVNLNMWGTLLEKVKRPHMGRDLTAEIEQAFQSVVDASQKLPDIIAQAQDVVITKDELRDLLWAARFPESYIDGGRRTGDRAVIPNIQTLEPSIKEPEQFTLWQGYNAATACLTHAMTLKPEAVEYHTRHVARILTPGKSDFLMDTGRDRREFVLAERERRAERKAAITGKVVGEPEQ